MDVGLVGKPNVGKSTIFKALTLADTEIANFPFTTIKANIGVGYVSSPCPCKELKIDCNPKNGHCMGGTRFSSVKLIDVAGLVPGAHEGKGLGNQFLDDLRQAEVLIHVVDISGRTNELGEPVKDHDPQKDMAFLEDEVNLWFAKIIRNNWTKIKNKIRIEHRKIVFELRDVLSGLGVSESHIKTAIDKAGLKERIDWSDDECDRFAFELRAISKQIMICANKIDSGSDNFKRLKDQYELVPVCAEAELALREAHKAGLIEYIPGDKGFNVKSEIEPKQKAALDFIRDKILDVWGSTGVQKILNTAVFEKLDLIVVYPVENEARYSDKSGNVLPDSFLLPRGSTTLDLAYKVHTDIGDNFVGAIDCRKKMKVGKDHVLQDGDIIKIHARS